MNDTEPREAWALHQLRLFFLALQFFTRLPIPRWVGFREAWLEDIARFFPLTGWAVAGCTALLAWGAGMALPPAPAILLSMAGGMLLTGALHEDGFADTCDGFGGGASRERVLEIMKDSRIGVFGALGLGMLLATKYAALASSSRATLPVMLLAAHPLSRLLATALIWRLDYARVEGKAAAIARRMRPGEFVFASICGLVPLAGLCCLDLLSWRSALAGLILAVLATAYLSRLFVRRVGGYTGDCLGAVQQLAEAGFYLGVVAYGFCTGVAP